MLLANIFKLIKSVDSCHNRGVYHRNLKPKHPLLDEDGNLKVSDFSLSALFESKRKDSLLHTTCGTPAYVAPEVISKRGYDGEKADIWTCGVILLVLMAGFLPFHEHNLMEMYRRISKAGYKCLQWFLPEVKKLLVRILDPNPVTRITLAKIMENAWFKKGFNLADQLRLQPEDKSDNHNDRKDDLPSSINDNSEIRPERMDAMKPICLNAFDIISPSPGFDLSGLFEKPINQKAEATKKNSAMAIVSKLEEIAQIERFNVKKKDGLVQMQGIKQGRKGQLAIEEEILSHLHFTWLKLRKRLETHWNINNFVPKS